MLASQKATKEPKPGEPMSERNVYRRGRPSVDQMWRGSRPRPCTRPGCHDGTLYGGPVRPLIAGRGEAEERDRWAGWKHWCLASCKA
jgi:hypothetical protein